MRPRRPRHLPRRTILHGGAVLGATALGVPLGCRPVHGTPLFDVGVASGDPLPESVVLWTRLTPVGKLPVPVRYVVATDPDLRDVVASGTTTAEDAMGFAVHADVGGLRPATTYYFQFEAFNIKSPIGRTKTAPAEEPTRLRMAVMCCAAYSHGYFHAYRALQRHLDLDVVVHLGDYLYEHANGVYGDFRRVEPVHELFTLDDYRARYAFYHREPDLAEAHRQFPWITVWDDHEFTNNAWSGGAARHPDGDPTWVPRREAAKKAYQEWLPLRLQAGDRIHRKLSFGGLVDLFMLDARMWGRTKPVPSNTDPTVASPERTILGADQEEWLIEGLAASTAKFKLIGNQVPISPLLGLDYPESWDGYPASRARLLSAIQSRNLSDVVFLSGDLHVSAAFEVTATPRARSYDRKTGRGAHAVEFVVPSVSSPCPTPFKVLNGKDNPHLKYLQNAHRGYVILDVTKDRVQATYHLFDHITPPDAEDKVARVLEVHRGQTKLRGVRAPAPPLGASPPAPHILR